MIKGAGGGWVEGHADGWRWQWGGSLVLVASESVAVSTESLCEGCRHTHKRECLSDFGEEDRGG